MEGSNVMSMWRSPEQKAAVIAAAQKRGMIPEQPTARPEIRALAPNADHLTTESTEGSGKPLGKRRREMNKTEAAFAAILEAKIRRGEIVSYEYEGITLRWGKLDGIRYTPDFTVFERVEHPTDSSIPMVRIRFIETKGGHIWPNDMQKFKQARNEWPLFGFEMWQLTGRQWAQLL